MLVRVAEASGRQRCILFLHKRCLTQLFYNISVGSRYMGKTYPARLEVLPSWYLTPAGRGDVPGTACATAEQLLAVRGGGGHCDPSAARENDDLFIGSVVVFHLKTGESRSEQIRAWEAIELFNKFQSIRNSGKWHCSCGAAGNFIMERWAV